MRTSRLLGWSARLLVALAVGSMISCAITGVAAADPVTLDSAGGDRIPIDNSYLDGTYPGFCQFPITLHVERSKEYVVRTATGPDGTVTQRITGSLVITIANADTGASMALNAGGPSTFIVYPDGSARGVYEGHALNVFSAQGRANTGEPAVVLTRVGRSPRTTPTESPRHSCLREP